jgi:hypothetical protein
MDLSARVLGSSAVAHLTTRNAAAVLTIGRDRWTRDDLSAVHCFNFQAAATLSRTLATFSIKSVEDVYRKVPPAALAVPGIGAIALAVLGAAFESRGLGGPTPLESWVSIHDRDSPIVTFATLKSRPVNPKPEDSHGKRPRPTRTSPRRVRTQSPGTQTRVVPPRRRGRRRESA